MGLFDKNDKGLFGGLFDFNGDGKTTWDEEYLAFKIFEECTKEENNDFDNDFDSDLFDNTDSSDKYEWRLYCEDGFEFGVDPEDYETEEEYNEALNEAKYGWRDNCESVLDTGVDPEDFETEDEYQDALEEERTAWRDTCEDGTDYGVEPTDYETEEEYEEALADAQESKNNAGITLNISVECPALDKLDEIKEEDYPNKRRYNAAYTLANEFLIYSNDEYEKKEKARCRFIIDNADTILAANYLSHDGGFLYAQAIKDNFSIPCSLPDEDETREMEFSQILCKIAKRDVPLSFEIWSWCLEKFLPYSEYDDFCGNDLCVEVIDDLYSFPDGYKTKLVHYMSDNDNFCKSVMMSSDEPANSIPELIAEAIKEKLFKTANTLFKYGLEKAKKEWKKINALTEGVILWCKNYGLNPDSFETQEEYREALNDKAKEARRQERDKRLKEQQLAEQAQKQEYENDKTIYTYCGVLLPFSSRPYSFRTEDDKVKIGDTVIVPVGEDKKEMKGKVVSVGQYSRLGVPYPVEKTKMIVRKIEEESE